MTLILPARTRANRALSLLSALVVLAACESSTASVPSDPVSVVPSPAPSNPASPSAPSTPAPDPAPPSNPSSTASVLVGAKLWVDPSSSAAKTAASWRQSRPADAAQMDKIAAEAQAIWIGNWNTNVAADVDAATTRITTAGAVPVFVAYNIPQRDCGGLSGGNSVGPDQYKAWIDGFAGGIGARRAVVVLEPDAVAGLDCLSSADRQTRLSLLAYAVNALGKLGSTSVYVDAGHARWQTAATMATRLREAGIAGAAGFSLNVSNFVGDAESVAYGQALSALVDNKHFIIDSGRSGLGPANGNEWCNPAGRALGTRPTTQTGIAGLDAFLWIKTPGESDGACNGAPAAGVWMPDYALGLAQRASF